MQRNELGVVPRRIASSSSLPITQRPHKIANVFCRPQLQISFSGEPIVLRKFIVNANSALEGKCSSLY